MVLIEIQTLKSNHKEADHRIIHHTHFASDQHGNACIVADDSDILVLLLYISRRCCCQIYFREGAHSSKNGILYHNVSLLSQHLGPSICDILPAFHALTGCDYTNQFYGRSEYGSFKIMQRKKEMINKLSSLDQEQKLLLEIRVTLCFLSRKKGRKENFQILIDYHLTNHH